MNSPLDKPLDYRKAWSPFVDRFSQFSLGFLESEIGIGPLHPRSTLATYAVLDPTLRLLVDGKVVERSAMTCAPTKVTEEASNPLAVRSETTFDSPVKAHVCIEIKNQYSTPRLVTIQLVGVGNEQHPSHMLALFPGAKAGTRRFASKICQGGVLCTLADPSGESDLPSVGVVVRCDVAKAAVSDLGYSLSVRKELAAGESFTFTVSIELEAEFSPEGAPDSNAENIAGVGGSLGRARLALLRSGLWGGNGTFGREVASLCTGDRSDFSSSFFWDTLFSSVAIASFHPTYARGALLSAFAGQDLVDGATPERKWNRSVSAPTNIRAPQSPIGSWAAREVARRTGNPSLLQEAFPLLWRNHQFWVNHADRDRDGLAEYVWSGQAADNSPLWDGYPREGVFGCSWLPPVASVALNSFLVWDARHLAEIAEELEFRHEAYVLRLSAEKRAEALERHCFIENEGRYWDLDHATGLHCKAKTFYMFWPIVMGLEVPPSVVKDLVENVLLDPRQFFGAVPFPSVAYDEPTYDPGGYWRGRAWPHITYWLISTLWRLGYTAEADLAASRTLEAMLREPGFPENLVSEPDSELRAGFLDYNWGAATACLLSDHSYRRSILPERTGSDFNANPGLLLSSTFLP